MAQTDTLTTQGFTAMPSELIHHGFETLRPMEKITTKIFSHIDSRPIVPALGAEIFGIDLRQPGLEAQAELREVLADRKVLVFRDQNLSPHQYAEFLRVFGTPVKEDMVVDENHLPEVGAIHTRSHEQQQINFWHMDHSFRELPTRVLSLYAKILPPVGGDTLFTSLAAAYDALSDELKERIEGLHCYHRVTVTQNTKRRHTKEEAEAMENAPPVVHPLVVHDPADGRRHLFVNVPIYCRGIVELPVAEGDELLRELYRHAQRPEFHFRLTWRPNTVVVWENNHTLHYPVSDYFPHERKLWRGVIKATESDRPISAGPHGRI
ncbi:MAG: taurine dioxygenase [Acetobacteraceae bacterium]|nr:taurine dioxygenase [Acetobacteraceae bacterium]